MVVYNNANVKLSDTQMKKLKTAVKNNTGTYRGRLVHSVLLINANIMQIQTMTQMQTQNPVISNC